MTVRGIGYGGLAALVALTTAATRVRHANAIAAHQAGRDPAAPATFRTRFETSKGVFVVEIHRDWAPHGADRFYAMAKSGFFDGARFFRVISGFMAQFGIAGDPKVATEWRPRVIPDDPVRQSNTRGMITFATAGPNTRTTQLFINFGDNHALDGQGFAPVGQVVEGMEVVDQLYAGYGDGPPEGNGPDQGRIESAGNAYLQHDFPKLDYITKAEIVTPYTEPGRDVGHLPLTAGGGGGEYEQAVKNACRRRCPMAKGIGRGSSMRSPATASR
jgi:peptidyl-prolyl cis-trans isomerase A (cyclophilin A)